MSKLFSWLRSLFVRPKKTEKRKFGDKGEKLVCKYLRNAGYDLLARNFAAGGGELDIVAQKGEVLAVVEVKTRSYYPNSKYGRPADAVDERKRRCIFAAAKAYRATHKETTALTPRFDIAEVLVYEDGRSDINYIEGAFHP